MNANEAADLLAVGRDANPDDIQRAYRRLALHVHPDHGGNPGAFRDLQQARDLLLGSMTHPRTTGPAPPRRHRAGAGQVRFVRRGWWRRMVDALAWAVPPSWRRRRRDLR